MNIQDAIDYVLACRGAKYTWWYSGPLTEGAPSWSANTPPPDPSEVIADGLFCAAVPNLMLRFLDLTIPYRPSYPSEDWDGGVLAYWEYYYDVSEWFNPNADYADGTLLIKQYIEGFTQGHVAVVYQGYTIESIDSGGGWPGLIWRDTVSQSNAWAGYDLAVRPENWLGVTTEEKPPEEEGGEVPETTKPDEYPFGWLSVVEDGTLTGVDMPPGSWGEPVRYEADGKLYIVWHSDPAWRKAREKVLDEVQYREKDGKIEVKDKRGNTQELEKPAFEQEYDTITEEKA